MEHVEQRPQARDAAINIRASARQRDLIDQAARALGKSRTDFMLETACHEAIDVLLDRRFLHLDADAFERFTTLLDTPLDLRTGSAGSCAA
ncbi:MAG TPA: DUF1778 domain-containing protein [Thermomicrobiales bacterium]|nr:DUF1778 domain-containing protein [Thermomicrobiales bacterium]